MLLLYPVTLMFAFYHLQTSR